ncbi:DUF305 domain-containing protein [Planomonospora sp. ID91781]|uniref:DUF305 domain-containing protein n=1 Tax=Planomonospora sphaerica TaxID=161355 RepID=A0A171D9N0_9ACTN|nr:MULTISPECIES: DUF305 domain-containing protein [Planomonospora]MBG0820133.1 DUF305 domain-containing protein [Planomonospora sp. ID91781]GAT67851.1 hypothetical protein PS9374_03511 [Planomonospora sphaerica]
MRASAVGAPVLAVVALLLVARCATADPPHPAAHPAGYPVAAGSGSAAHPAVADPGSAADPVPAPASGPGSGSAPAPGSAPALGSGSGSAPAPEAVSAGTVPGAFNATDVAWLQLMIPMTEQALDLLVSAPQRAADPEVARLAAELDAGHRAQLRTLRGLLKRSGTPPVNVHEGHDMPGMVTATELAEVNRVEGAAFDRLFTEHVGEYLRQSVQVARGEQGSGADRETRAFAAAVERTRAGELIRLTGLGGASG